MQSKYERSKSYLDVCDVAPDLATVYEGQGDAKNIMRLRKTSTGNILQELCIAKQEHENQVAEIVIVCEPEGTSLMMGGLHPRASLYEKPVNLDAAKQVAHMPVRNKRPSTHRTGARRVSAGHAGSGHQGAHCAGDSCVWCRHARPRPHGPGAPGHGRADL